MQKALGSKQSKQTCEECGNISSLNSRHRQGIELGAICAATRHNLEAHAMGLMRGVGQASAQTIRLSGQRNRRKLTNRSQAL